MQRVCSTPLTSARTMEEITDEKRWTWERHFTSVLGCDPVCDFVVLRLRHDPPRHHFTGFRVGTTRNHPLHFCRGYSRQAQQLLFCGSVQIERLVAAPAFANSCRHSFRIVLYIGGCFRGLLLTIPEYLVVVCSPRARPAAQLWERVDI